MNAKIFIYCCISLLSYICISCTDEDSRLSPISETGLTIHLDLGNSSFSRGISDNEKLNDQQIDDLHVFIFDSDGNIVSRGENTSCYWHFGKETLMQGSGTVTLMTGNWKAVFEKDKEYDVYVVANLYESKSNDDQDQNSFSFIDDLSSITTLDELKNLTDQNFQIYQSISNSKKLFTMSGCVEKWEPASSPNIYTLSIPLTRLAARIEVNITINFNEDQISGYKVGIPQFELVNYTTKAPVLSGHDDTFTDRAWASENTFSGNNGTDQNQFVTYTYPNEWNTDLLHETYVLVNVPLIKEENVNVENNYYKVPLRLTTDDKRLERNHWYKVQANIYEKGNTVPDNPVTVEDVHYEVAPWNDIDIDINGDIPEYLELSEYDVVMRNVDTYDLTFASSSQITSATIGNIYYINKNGEPISVTNNDIYAISTTGLNGTLSIQSPVPINKTIRYMTLKVTNSQGLSKTVTIKQYPLEYITGIAGLYSYLDNYNGVWPRDDLNNLFSFLYYSGGEPSYEYNAQIPDNIISGFTDKKVSGLDGKIGTNAIMKSKFYVENENGGRIFRIDYSYFTGFKKFIETDYNQNAINYVRKYIPETKKTDKDILVPGNEHKKYILNITQSNQGNYIQIQENEYIRVKDGNGQYNITYTVSENNGTYLDIYGVETTYNESYKYYKNIGLSAYVRDNEAASNNRMYHVVITSTSDQYKLARPPMTSKGENATVVQNNINNEFVSPSFMLASQLGNSSVISWSDAQTQCQQYVEVGSNGEEYNDWRLPTLEEIKIIKKYQEDKDAQDVMDAVLEIEDDATPYYWTAIENIYHYTGNNTAGTPTNCRVRCVRDFHVGEPTE